MAAMPAGGRSVHLRYPPIDGFWTWDIKRNRVYGDANLSDYFGLTLEEFSRGAPLERCMESIEAEDRLRVNVAIRRAVERRSSFREVCKVRSEKMGLRKILAVGQCYVDSLGEAAVYPGWFVDLTQEEDCEEASLREIHQHIEQGKEISRSIGQDLLFYLLDNAHEEVQLRLGGGSRRRKSS
ncbi:hypothetical protein [Mesorhizobium sp. M4B.F.Ca.ET.143.01.1.1]|uniref:hypothetical protein n=1 Tax=Mesorhizobium sp. M4B.F.Ca.ET.143.01.1.1 TaxID=2563947 RepID=UPI001093E77C|nr:hypothetical protein [Mesorhizobium sp. M4B.F.Ca.ET.143.01.1.1]TGV23910.1 hypothetical protein EN786_21810 [Mesorhizobium sp. M4B.F.Ca.ET.143.01.1.1]